MKLSTAFAVLTVLSAADAKSLRSTQHDPHHEQKGPERDTKKLQPSFLPTFDDKPELVIDELFEENDSFAGNSQMTDYTEDFGFGNNNVGYLDEQFPLDDILASMYGCVEEIKFVCYDDTMTAVGNWGMWEGEKDWDDSSWDGWLYDNELSDSMIEEMLEDILSDDDDGWYEDKSLDSGGGWRKLGSPFISFDMPQGEQPEINTEAMDSGVTASIQDLKERISDVQNAWHVDGERGPRPQNGVKGERNRHGFEKFKGTLDRLVDGNEGELTKAELKEKLKEVFSGHGLEDRRHGLNDRQERSGLPFNQGYRKGPDGRPDGEHAGHGRPDGEHAGHGRPDGEHAGHGRPADEGSRNLQDLNAQEREDLRATRDEIRGVIQDLVEIGDSKFEIRQKIEQRMEEQPEFKDLMMKKIEFMKEMKMGKNYFGEHKFSPRPHPNGDGKLVGGPRPFSKTDMDRPPRFAGHKKHPFDRKLTHFSEGAWLGDSCPNGDLDFLVQNLSPECADIMFKLDISKMPLFEPFPDFRPPHHGGRHYGGRHYGGPHHKFVHNEPPPPHCGGMFVGILMIGITFACIRRCYKNRRNSPELIQGQIVRSGAPIVPTSVVVNSGQGQPQVFTGHISDSNSNQYGRPIFGYPAPNPVGAPSVGQQQEAPIQSSFSTNAGIPITSNDEEKSFTFAPAPQLSF